MGRPGSHPLVLRGDKGLSALLGLREELAVQMRGVGLKVDGSYTPHITLLWGDRLVEENPVLPFAWTVREFVLLLSVIGHSRHEVVDRWGLH